jgi:hypothetical protein
MAKIFNIARMSTATAGTGAITVGAAVAGYLSFAGAGLADGDTFTYGIEDGTSREIGRGVYTAAGTSFTRTVLKSTNSNTAISLSGTAQVFITAAAEDIVNSANNLSDLASAATARTNLGLAIGTNVQAFDAQLSSSILQNSQSAAYTLVAADAEKHILHPTADTTARTFKIPANSVVAFPVGTAVTFVAQHGCGVVTLDIATGGDALYWAPSGGTGNRTLAANGLATILKVAATEWMISGSGLT